MPLLAEGWVSHTRPSSGHRAKPITRQARSHSVIFKQHPISYYLEVAEILRLNGLRCDSHEVAVALLQTKPRGHSGRSWSSAESSVGARHGCGRPYWACDGLG